MTPARVPRTELLSARPSAQPKHGRSGTGRRSGRSRAAPTASRTPAAVEPQPKALVCDLAARLAAEHYELPVAEVVADTRRSKIASRARHVAIYIAHVALGVPLDTVATQFRRDRTTASYACHAIEDARDDPAFDVALSGLELTARVLLEAGGRQVHA